MHRIAWDPSFGLMHQDSEDIDWEARRLSELDHYNLDFHLPDPILDAIALELLQICNTTSVIISVFGKKLPDVKACAGERFVPNPKLLFCDLVLHRGSYIEIEDILNAPVFKYNPAVLVSPMTRFFSSTPLINVNGFILGSICALHNKPTQFTQKQRQEIFEQSLRVMEYWETRRTK